MTLNYWWWIKRRRAKQGGGSGPSNARVTTGGDYRVTTDGAYRVWTAAVAESSLLTGIVGHWSLDEASGTRVDSTESNFDLAENAGAVASVAGKVGNAAKILDNPDTVNQLENDAVSISVAGHALTIACWLKVNALTGGNASPSQNQAFSTIILYTADFNDLLRGPTIAAREDNSLFITAAYAASDAFFSNIVADQWYFVVVDYDFTTGSMNLYIDGVLADTATGVSIVSYLDSATFVSVQIGSPNYMGTHDWIAVDEPGIWTRILTSDERATLYNAGAGRAYPFS